MAMCERLLHCFESIKDGFMAFGIWLKDVMLPKF
jgi:hypothetical protein